MKVGWGWAVAVGGWGDGCGRRVGVVVLVKLDAFFFVFLKPNYNICPEMEIKSVTYVKE